MSIGSARKIESAVSSASGANRTARPSGHHSQSVENIDTTNSVLVRDDSDQSGDQKESFARQQNKKSPDFKSATPDISGSRTL